MDQSMVVGLDIQNDAAVLLPLCQIVQQRIKGGLVDLMVSFIAVHGQALIGE
jgi:hypothetical protein